ncbi:MAG: threonine--tRNA ligase [Phycisphaerae bacterium]
MPTVRLPDGSRVELSSGATLGQLVEQIGGGAAVVGARVRLSGVDAEELVDLATPINQDVELVRLVRLEADDADGLYILRHSCAHVMAEAICSLWPQTKLVYGPAVEEGFYYDIDLDRPVRPEDFGAIEAKMAEIVAADRPFVRYELPREQGLAKLRAEGNRYKLDNAERSDGASLSFYVTGREPGQAFEDLCRGPHLARTGQIGAFKLTSVAGAYYRGDASQKMLQRVYGTAWPSRGQLEQYLQRLAEARRRDHRRIGQELGLYVIDQQVGGGLVLWKPKGATIRYVLEEFIRQELVRHGYQPVYTPHIGRLELYETSGHYPYYKDVQFAPIEMPDGERLLLRPMNCPHHIKIYASEPHSYRDLPVRLAEFGAVYRYEQSGELSGMARVRGFTIDDAHIFCTPEQLLEELDGCLRLARLALDSVGLRQYRVRVGLRDRSADKYVGSDEAWDRAEEAVRAAAAKSGLHTTEERGEAAFYGPKIDFVVKDCIGREQQLGTVQVDYNLPERFGLEYIGPDNAPHRPVMIHRAPFGSFERFVAILIEHYAGAFPLWLAPVQVVVATISQKSDEYGRKVFAALGRAGLRAELDVSSDKVGAKIRRASLQKVPYILVVGEQEAAEGTVNVRSRGRGEQGRVGLEQFIAACQAEVASRALEG